MAPLVQYIVLHQSCRNQPGIAAVQAAHAAAESIREVPVPGDTIVCVLVADSSDQLETLSKCLAADGIRNALIHEPDPPYDGAATALGIEPTARELVKPHVGGLKVFR